MTNRYEYSVVNLDAEDRMYLERLLNECAAHGWEFVQLDWEVCVFRKLLPPAVEDIGDPDVV